MELWRATLLPSIREEIKLELNAIKREIKDLSDKCIQIERSQDFMAKRYDQMIESVQVAKKQIDANSKQIKNQADRTTTLQENIDDLFSQMDELQQYSRRECLEISGIPKLESENVNRLVTETCSAIDVK